MAASLLLLLLLQNQTALRHGESNPGHLRDRQRCSQLHHVGRKLRLRVSLVGQDSRLSPDRPGFRSRTRNPPAKINKTLFIPGGTRTRNLPLRRGTRYPLRHRDSQKAVRLRHPGIEPGPPRWQRGILATEPMTRPAADGKPHAKRARHASPSCLVGAAGSAWVS